MANATITIIKNTCRKALLTLKVLRSHSAPLTSTLLNVGHGQAKNLLDSVDSAHFIDAKALLQLYDCLTVSMQSQVLIYDTAET